MIVVKRTHKTTPTHPIVVFPLHAFACCLASCLPANPGWFLCSRTACLSALHSFGSVKCGWLLALRLLAGPRAIVGSAGCRSYYMCVIYIVIILLHPLIGLAAWLVWVICLYIDGTLGYGWMLNLLQQSYTRLNNPCFISSVLNINVRR